MTDTAQRPFYSWLLLDADGTLLDFRHAETRALDAVATRLRLASDELLRAAYHTANDALWREFEAGRIRARDVRTRRFECVVETLGLHENPQDLSEFFLDCVVRETTLLQGAGALLDALKGRFGLVLLTNGFADVQRARLSRLGLDPIFDHVIISEEVGAAKPGRDVFDIAFDRMGSPSKRRVLMVGDSLSSDIRGGHDYGIDTCWFNPNGERNAAAVRPTYEVRGLAELAHLLVGVEAGDV